MSGLPWFRFYTEFAGDPAVQMLSFDDQRHFVMILCFKGSGFLDKPMPSAEFRNRAICKALGLEPVVGADVLRRLQDVGLVDSDWQPLNWDKRQYASDISTARVRKFRSESKKDKKDTDTERNVSCNVSSAFQENQEKPVPPGLDLVAWTTWIEYRNSIKRPLKPVSIPAAQRSLAAFGSDQSAVVEQSVANGWQGLFPLKTVNGSRSNKHRGLVM